MTFDLSSLLLFGLPLGLCAGLLVYALNLRSALSRVELQNQTEAALAITLRTERDQALQNAIRLEAALDSERKQGLGRIESLNEAKEALTSQFKNLANEILEDKSKRFTEQNVASLDALLKPLQTKLSEFKEQVNTSYGNEARERFDTLVSEVEATYYENIGVVSQKDFALAVKSSRCAAACFAVRANKAPTVRDFLARMPIDSLLNLLGYRNG